MPILLKAVAMTSEVSSPATTISDLKVFGRDTENFIIIKVFYMFIIFFSK